MNTPQSLKSAANALIALGFFYLLIISIVVYMSISHDTPPDTFGKIFGGSIVTLVVLMGTSAFLLYRSNPIGKYIWWICCPFVLLQFPIGTFVGVMVFSCLREKNAKAAFARPRDETLNNAQ